MALRGALISLAISTSAGPSSAGRVAARLEYAGEVCAEPMLRARVAALVGHDPFEETGADGATLFDANVAADGVRLRAVLEVVDAAGGHAVRTLNAADCPSLIDALALVIAMVVVAPPTTTSPPPSPPLRPPQVLKVAPTAPRFRPSAMEGVAGTEADTAGAPAVFVGGRIRWQGRSVELALSVERSHGAEVGSRQTTVTRVAGAVAPCLHRGPLAACALVVAGVFDGSGTGGGAVREERAPFWGVGGRLALEHRLASRFALRYHVGAAVLGTKTRFLVGDAVVWESPSVDGRLGISLLVRFP